MFNLSVADWRISAEKQRDAQGQHPPMRSILAVP